MTNTGQEILDKIKEQKIQPKKRWEFLFRDYLLWFAFILAIIFGSLASSVSIFMIKHAFWSSFLPNFHPLKRLWINLPLFWLLSLLFFCLLAWYDIKNTKRGYKYHPLLIAFFSIILSVVLGMAIYLVGFGERLEDIFFRRVPLYQHMFRQGGRMFVAPEQGHMGGVIMSVSDDFVTVEDFQGNIWQINTSTDRFYPGQRIMLIGKMSGNDFICENIQNWIRPQKDSRRMPMFPRPVDELK